MKASLSEAIDCIRSLSLFVREESPRLIYRLEAAEKIEPQDSGFLPFLRMVYQVLGIERAANESDVVDLWALDLWEYNQREFEYFSQYPERFTGFSECGIERILSHIALTLDFDGPAYLFVMYDMAEKRIALRAEIPKGDYEEFLGCLPF
jgi:hypothetical protein